MAVMLVWALRLWIHPKPRLLWPPLGWVVLVFAAYAIGRYLTADIEYVARQELIRVLMYAFLFFAIVNNLYRQESAQIISFTVIFLAMGISCYAVYQFLTHSNHVWNFVSPYPGRSSGTYISPNNLAGFLGNAAAAGGGLHPGGANQARRPDFAWLRGAGHAGGNGGDVLARRLGGGRPGVAGPSGILDFSPQPPAASLFASGNLGWRRRVFCHQLFVEDDQLHQSRGRNVSGQAGECHGLPR